MVSIDSTILILEIFRNGIEVVNRQTPIVKPAASIIGKIGTAVNCRVELAAAWIKIVQIYPSILPITEEIIP